VFSNTRGWFRQKVRGPRKKREKKTQTIGDREFRGGEQRTEGIRGKCLCRKEKKRKKPNNRPEEPPKRKVKRQGIKHFGEGKSSQQHMGGKRIHAD